MARDGGAAGARVRLVSRAGHVEPVRHARRAGDEVPQRAHERAVAAARIRDHATGGRLEGSGDRDRPDGSVSSRGGFLMQLPHDVLLVTVGADVQNKYVAVLTMGWTELFEGWALEFEQID